MHIVSLTAENVKRLKAVTITPNAAGLVVIGGNNANGKSSVLDSIAMALGGGSAIPDRPIHDGEDKAQIILELDGLTVTRKFTKSGTSLVVSDSTGAKLASPQDVLNTLTARVSFDPLAFTLMKPDAQVETLRKLTGLDFTKLDAERAEKYQERTDKNREVKALTIKIAGMLHDNEAGLEYRQSTELTERIAAAGAKNAANEKERDALDAINDDLAKHQALIDDADGHVIRLRNELAAMEARAKELRFDRDTLTQKRDLKIAVVRALVDEDISALVDEAGKLDAINESVRKNLERQSETKRLRALEKEAEALTKRIEGIDADKERQLRAAQFPIAGLSFTGGGVTYNDIPFEQSSAAERLRVSVAIGAAMSPKLKVALVRDGSLLDDNSLALLAKCAEENGLQCWVERVGKGKECSVIIEDGEVEA